MPGGLALPAPPLSSTERAELETESVTNGQWLNQLCLSNKASIKITDGWGLKSFKVCEYLEIWEDWYLLKMMWKLIVLFPYFAFCVCLPSMPGRITTTMSTS